ncbi:hypothetical protein PR202_gb10814 [Eleusine coracana subsp. coracana]|uniref:Electron transporter n=1 Tax=Eleusine coracana subsp. coracana TaxID=191504 RepID=A0AAV5EKY3_ELECO|nr:hypothetical protein PR202_gb10814 [Eleusine coracana subsp. coracana]
MEYALWDGMNMHAMVIYWDHVLSFTVLCFITVWDSGLSGLLLSWLFLELRRLMEVEALDKKGHKAFAMAAKSFSSSERQKRSKRLVYEDVFPSGTAKFFGSGGKDANNVISLFLDDSYLENVYAKDDLRSSEKTFVLPKPEDVKAKVNSDLNKEVQPGRGAQSTLRKEILQLEKHLKDQQLMRGTLEKALGPNAAPVNMSVENPMPQAANELIREIATLELEVKNMEQYLLSLYRRAFEQQAPSFSPPDRGEAPKPSVSSWSGQLRETAVVKKPCKSRGDSELRSSYPLPQLRRNDTLTDCSTSARFDRAVDSDVLRCQSALSYRGVCSSRILPSEDDSLGRALRSCHSQPFSFLEEGETGASGMISLAEYLGTNVADHIPETPNNLSEEMVRCMAGIYCRLAVPPLVHHGSSSSPTSSFSSTSAISPQLILFRLETVDLRRMTIEEKIAFWVNIHNALLMHWLRTLLYPRIKSKVSKAGHEWRAFAVAQSEPLLRFALCSGSHSDPAVRVYTPKRLFHQLEAAKEEFIRATAGVWKEQKLLLPKLVEAYAKDVKLSPQGLVDMVQRYLPESIRMAVQRCGGGRSASKVVEWVPYNPSFRYLLARDLAFPHLS